MGKDVSDLLQNMLNDRGVPKNVKTAIEDALKILEKPKPDKVKISEAISILDEIGADPNLPIYTRTILWDVVSKLEAMK